MRWGASRTEGGGGVGEAGGERDRETETERKKDRPQKRQNQINETEPLVEVRRGKQCRKCEMEEKGKKAGERY